MSKICVIYTGGTIGSKVNAGYVSLESNCVGLLTNEYLKKYGTSVCFEEINAINMLSENIQPEDINVLKKTVAEALTSDCDGIIITHGTDTQCFSANLFSQIFCDTPKPIVYVSALLPLSEPDGNGFTNFDGAVAFIKENIPGVYVSFANPGKSCCIHLASRVVEPVQINGALHSVDDLYFGSIIDGKFVHNTVDLNPSVDEIRNNKSHCDCDEIDSDILVIHSRALLNYDMYDIERISPKAVVIGLYHSGTTCTIGDKYNTVKFIEKCAKKNIPVILGPVDKNATVYSSTDSLQGTCIFAENMSFEMLVTKVMLALGSGKDIETLLNANNFFEKIR